MSMWYTWNVVLDIHSTGSTANTHHKPIRYTIHVYNRFNRFLCIQSNTQTRRIVNTMNEFEILKVNAVTCAVLTVSICAEEKRKVKFDRFDTIE